MIKKQDLNIIRCTILNQREFRGLKNSFAHSTKLEKGSIFEANSKLFFWFRRKSMKDSSTTSNHFESDLDSYEIFLRVSIFETKWFSTALFSPVYNSFCGIHMFYIVK